METSGLKLQKLSQEGVFSYWIAIFCKVKRDKNEICELRFMAYVFLGLATTELTMQ